MAILGPWTDPKIFAERFDFSGVSNLATLQYNAELLDKSTFGQTTKIHTPGLKNISLEASGFAEFAADKQDDVNFENIGSSVIPVQLYPSITPAVGDLAYFFQAAQARYNVGGPHGQMVPFSFDAHGSSGHPMPRGYILEPGTTSWANTGNGTGTSNPGAVGATQYLYAALNVFQFVGGGGTMDIVIQSDDNGGFSSPTTRITFS